MIGQIYNIHFDFQVTEFCNVLAGLIPTAIASALVTCSGLEGKVTALCLQISRNMDRNEPITSITSSNMDRNEPIMVSVAAGHLFLFSFYRDD